MAGPYNAGTLQRANLLACGTIIHVVDTVLLPSRSLQSTLPYTLAVGGVAGQQPGGGGGAAPAQPGAAPGANGTPGGAAGAGGQQSACYRSIEQAIAATPQLSILRTTLGLSGVS